MKPYPPEKWPPVFGRADTKKAPAFAGSDEFGVPFQEAIDFFRQKLNLPSQTWRDIEGRSHDRAFVVAGAMKDALLADLRAEIDKAIAGKTTLEEFRKNFDAIVARHGWTGWTGEGSEAGRAWRTRVIYETNLKTAYAAGRYAQMTDPDIVKVYKWWRYRHAFYRQPERARPEHRDIWNGTVLRFDDPWWDTHYPPNGWNCSCGVETLSDRELKAEGIEPDEAPPITTRTVIDPKTGEKVQVPNGIDFGWDHAPGQDWSRGLVPRELRKPLDPPVGPRRPVDLQPLGNISQPFKSERLPDSASPEDAVKAFLSEFGASWDQPSLFRDASGHVIPISRELFTRGDGRFKGGSRARHLDMPQLAETIKDPDEIWVEWLWHRDKQQWVLGRRYLRSAPNGLGFGSFTWTSEGWTGSTVFAPTRGSANKPDPKMLEDHRSGSLLYRRPKE